MSTTELPTDAPTPSQLRRERQKAETREQLLDAARELFVERGLEATTMRAVAARVGFTATTIYHHFRDKQELFEQLCARDFLELARALNRIGRMADPIERLRNIGYAYADFALDHPSQYRFMFMTVQVQQPQNRDEIQHGNPDEDAYAFLRHTVVDAIASERLRPELADADQVAQMMWGTVHGVVSLRITKGDDDWIEWADARATARATVDMAVRGILA